MASEEPIADVDVDDNKEDTQTIDEAYKEEKKNGRRSEVWNHFKYIPGAPAVHCPYCKRSFASNTRKNGTTALGNHLTSVCKTSPLYKKKDLKRQSTLNFKPNTLGAGSGSLATHSFSQQRCREKVAKMCIKDNQPFSLVDDEGFRELLWELNPLFKIPSRWTVARDCLSIHKEESKKLKDILKGQRVSLTTDTWSSVQNFNYMCLTAHWIDDDWVLQKRILNFCSIPNHRGDTIGRLVYTCLQNWGIDKVFTVTVDNASSNDGAIRFLKSMLKGPTDVLDCKYLHLRCCAHIINLVVKDGLEEQCDSISKIRNVVRYVRSSPARYSSFKESVERVAIRCKRKPCLDVDTRWNSTLLMLETAVKFEDAFDRLFDIDLNYRSYFHDDTNDDGEEGTRKRKRLEGATGAPKSEDWEKARNFIDYLKIFYEVTNKISGSKYVTSNLFFSELVKMQATITRMCANVDEEKQKMAKSMKKKYDKYWDNIENINLLLYVAVALDPRHKLRYVTFCVEMIYGNGTDKAKEIIGKVKKTMEDLFDHYEKKAEKNKVSNKHDSSSSGVPSTLGDTIFDLEREFDKFDDEVEDCKNEVEIYLADGKEKRDDKFDVIGWWKMNSVKFPILSQIARHVLAMPISTVASESAFSTGSRVIDKYRSSLNPDTAEALICTQNWIRSSPADIELLHMPLASIEELNEKLGAIEIGIEIDEENT